MHGQPPNHHSRGVREPHPSLVHRQAVCPLRARPRAHDERRDEVELPVRLQHALGRASRSDVDAARPRALDSGRGRDVVRGLVPGGGQKSFRRIRTLPTCASSTSSIETRTGGRPCVGACGPCARCSERSRTVCRRSPTARGARSTPRRIPRSPPATSGSAPPLSDVTSRRLERRRASAHARRHVDWERVSRGYCLPSIASMPSPTATASTSSSRDRSRADPPSRPGCPAHSGSRRSGEDIADAQFDVLPNGQNEGANTFTVESFPLISNESTSSESGSGQSGSGSGQGGSAPQVRVDLPDVDSQTTRYFWTVVMVEIRGRPTPVASSTTTCELPQDVCQEGRVSTFAKLSKPAITASRTPYVSGLTPKGRLLSIAGARPTVYSTPLVAWQPVIGATSLRDPVVAHDLPLARERQPQDAGDIDAAQRQARPLVLPGPRAQQHPGRHSGHDVVGSGSRPGRPPGLQSLRLTL